MSVYIKRGSPSVALNSGIPKIPDIANGLSIHGIPKPSDIEPETIIETRESINEPSAMNLIIDKKEKTRRLSICSDCPEKIVSTVPVINVELDRCGKCKCLLATRVYTSCPIGKWS